MNKKYGVIAVILSSLLGLVLFQNLSRYEPKPITQDLCLAAHGVNYEWSNESEIAIDGYNGNAMEPKLSADQVVLFFNDRPSSDSAMNIHYAILQASGRYQYVGLVNGTVSNDFLDGVPALDQLGNFYFVSTRDLGSSTRTIFNGKISVLGYGQLDVINVKTADAAIPVKPAGEIDMDVAVTLDGKYVYASRANFSGKPYPDKSKLLMYNVNNGNVSVNQLGSLYLFNINNQNCRVYAASLSADQKELYYTVFAVGVDPRPDSFRIVVAKRSTANSSFNKGEVISAIQGPFIEGPDISINDGGKTLVYHKYDVASSRYKIYQVKRLGGRL